MITDSMKVCDGGGLAIRKRLNGQRLGEGEDGGLGDDRR